MSAAAYGELVELAQRELELVRREAYDDLGSVWEERDSLIARLPDAAPAEARGALERAAGIQSQVTTLLTEQAAARAGELRRLHHGRTAVRGYTPQLRRMPLIERAG